MSIIEKPKCIIIDDVNSESKNCVYALNNIIKLINKSKYELKSNKINDNKSKKHFNILRPIIIITNDDYNKLFRFLRQHAFIIKLQ